MNLPTIEQQYLKHSSCSYLYFKRYRVDQNTRAALLNIREVNRNEKRNEVYQEVLSQESLNGELRNFIKQMRHCRIYAIK